MNFNIQDFIKTALIKLQFIDSESEELDLEALMLWVFLLIVAFRSLFVGVTINIGHSIKWVIPDSNMAVSIPMLYSLLSNSHRRYLESKNNNKNQTNVNNNDTKGN